jgi:hypothetical protein
MIRFFRHSAIAFSFAAASQLASGAALPPSDLVAQLAKRATLFWDQFSAVTCTESVIQRKLEPGGKEIVRKKSDFDYLILLQLAGDELMVEESRLLQGKAPKESDRALLATNGFSTLLLVFHPIFQSSFDFTSLPEETVAGKTLWKIGFVFRDGHRSPSVLQIRTREYPIAWKGVAWIDPANSAIVRIQAHLRAPMEDVGLESLDSDVSYAPVPMRGEPDLWLPKTAVVEAATKRQRWHNAHEFSHYRQFSVDTDATVEAPKSLEGSKP